MFSIFNKKNCDNCSSLREQQLVKNPRQLTALIIKIKLAVVNGVIAPLALDEKRYEKDFSLLLAEPPWSDIIVNRFQCPKCGAQFELFANTYQGSNKMVGIPNNESHNKLLKSDCGKLSPCLQKDANNPPTHHNRLARR
jgi:hypothetical protein